MSTYPVKDARGARSRPRSPSSARRRTRPIGAFATSSRIRCPTASPRGWPRAPATRRSAPRYDHPIALVARPLSRGRLARAGVERASSRRSTCPPTGARRRDARSRVRRHQRLRRRRLPSALAQVARLAGAARGSRWSAYLADGVELSSRRRARLAVRLSRRSSTRSAPATSRQRRRRRDHAVGLRPLHRLSAADRSARRPTAARSTGATAAWATCRRTRSSTGCARRAPRVVQVNHPRTPPASTSATSRTSIARGCASTSRSTPSTATTGSREVSATDLGLPDGARCSRQLQLARGLQRLLARSRHRAADGERLDMLVDTNLRDWMNFLSFGFTPTAVGDSDSHQWLERAVGACRARWCACPTTRRRRSAAGLGRRRGDHGGGQAPRDVVVTNGPFMKLTVDGAGIGHDRDARRAGALGDSRRSARRRRGRRSTPSSSSPTPPSTCRRPRAPRRRRWRRSSASARARRRRPRCAGAIGGARPLIVDTAWPASRQSCST